MKKQLTTAVVLIVAWSVSTFSSKATYDVPTNGLVGYWPGNGNAHDESSTANNGSFGGSYAPGPMGNAFNLGTAKVSIPNNAAYDFKSYSGWSVGFWFNGNGSTIGPNNGLFLGQDNASGYNPKWFIDYGYSVYANGPYYFFHVNDYNQERIFLNSQSQPAPTGWNQLTVTIDNTNNGTVNFYLNGQFIGTGTLGSYVLRTTAPLIFGQAESLTYNGLLSEVVIYNRVLSTNEVVQLATIPPLAITDQPKSVIISSGNSATFSVGVAGGFAPFSFQWMFNGTNIDGATNALLAITNVSAAQTGVYSVSITNVVGSSVTSAGATLTTADVAMFAGIIINGVPGTNYTIQSTSALGQTNWAILTNVAIPSPRYIYIDYASNTNSSQFYQVLIP